MRGNITTDPIYIKKDNMGMLWTILYHYIQQLRENGQITWKINYKEIYSLNGPPSIKEIDLIVKDLPTKKTPGPDGLASESYKKISRRNSTNSTQIILENTRRGNICQLFYWDLHYPDTIIKGI